MDAREASSSLPGRERSSPKVDQSLHLRLYFRRHMTDLVKLFGYAGLSIDDAKERLLPLRKEYGDPPNMAAIEELVEIDHSRLPHWVSLKRNVLLLSRQILGEPATRPPDREITTSPGLRTLDVATLTRPPPEDPAPGAKPPAPSPSTAKAKRKRGPRRKQD